MKTAQQLFDPIRKKWVAATPEENVRNALIVWLLQKQGINKNRIAVEQSLALNGLKKRADLVIYNAAYQPILLAECKAPQIKICQNTLNQAARYNMHFKVPYLLLTNGETLFVFEVNHHNQTFDLLPNFPDINN